VKNIQKPSGEVLVSPRRAEEFLAAFANVTPVTGFGSARRLTSQFAEFFPPGYLESGGLMGYFAKKGDIPPLESDPVHSTLTGLIRTAKRLQRVWDERDQRIREWYLFELRREFRDETNPEEKGPPPLNPFEWTLYYFQRNWDRARHCENPDCPAPYFLSRDRKPQKYCSPICAGPAKTAAKLRWWNEHPEAHKKPKTQKRSKGARR
jgi:hypothetical protein